MISKGVKTKGLRKLKMIEMEGGNALLISANNADYFYSVNLRILCGE
jgi:hypothetical protein